jgi:hypothetical protein
MITGKINVKAITKSRLFVGEKGTYLDVTLIPTPNGKYGDYMIVESITKAERDAGKKGVILGNAKNIGTQMTAPQQSEEGQFGKGSSVVSDDIPF